MLRVLPPTVRLLGVALALVALATPGRAATEAAGLELAQRVEYPGSGPWHTAADLAFSGDHVYGVQRTDGGGIRIYERRSGRLREAGFFRCPGTGTEVEVVRPGIVAFLSLGGGCTREPRNEVVLLSVRDPARVRFLGSVPVKGTHTFSVHPNGRYLYTSGGGFAAAVLQTEIVDVSDPRRPWVAGEYGDPDFNCHDIGFVDLGDRVLAGCPAGAETQLWDVTDPAAPTTVSAIRNPAIFFHHSVAFDDTGTYLVIGDEAYVASTCTKAPTGALWVYDVSDPAQPALRGTYSVGRGTPASSYRVSRETTCTAHNFEFVDGTKKVVASWYTGGVTVVDLEDPLQPREVAYYRDDETNYWGAYWHDGIVYASNHMHGIDVLVPTKPLRR